MLEWPSITTPEEVMDLPVDRWNLAIAELVSRRSYGPEPVPPEAAERLERTCRDFRPFPEARAAFVREPVDTVAKGIVGSYGRVSGAPGYPAFIGRMDSPRVQECVGYTGQALVLEATALGLATCWVGGLFRPGAVSSSLALEKNERVICISPVGCPAARPSLTDRTFKALAGSAKRRSLEELVESGLVPEGGLRKALEAARLSPSDMLPNERDDDHLLALYKRNGHWGAVAKSNFVGLRFREPIYRTLRELIMSYFEQFYNVEREKTLRCYTLPLNLKLFDPLDWMTKDDSLEQISHKLDRIRRVPVLTQPMMSALSLVDKRSYQAGLMGANEAGLYKPTTKKMGDKK